MVFNCNALFENDQATTKVNKKLKQQQFLLKMHEPITTFVTLWVMIY